MAVVQLLEPEEQVVTSAIPLVLGAAAATTVVMEIAGKRTLLPIHIIIIQLLSAPRYSVVSNVRKCSAPLMAWKCTRGDHTMGNDLLHAICATKPLAMKSPSPNIGLYIHSSSILLLLFVDLYDSCSALLACILLCCVLYLLSPVLFLFCYLSLSNNIFYLAKQGDLLCMQLFTALLLLCRTCPVGKFIAYASDVGTDIAYNNTKYLTFIAFPFFIFSFPLTLWRVRLNILTFTLSTCIVVISVNV